MSIKDTVKAFVNAVEERNADKVASYLAEDVDFENMPEGSTITGKDEVAQQFKNFFGMTSKIKWNIERELYSDNIAMVERKAHICFNDKDIIMPMISVFEVRNNKVTLFRDYFDSETFAKQIA